MDDTKQALLDLEIVNDYIGTSLLDEKMRWWITKYKHHTGWYLRMQLNSGKFIICNRLGARII